MSKDITKIREQLYKMTKNNALSLERYNAHSISVGFKKTGDRETDELAVIFSVNEKKPKHLLKPEEHIPSYGHTFGVSLKTDVVQEPMASIDFSSDETIDLKTYQGIENEHLNLSDAKIDSIPENLFDSSDNQTIQVADSVDGNIEALGLVNRVHSSVLSSFPTSAYRGFVRPLSGGASSIHHKSSAATLGLIVTDREDGKPVLLSNNHVYGDSIMVGVEALTKGDNNNPLLLSAVQPSNGDYNSRFSEPRDVSYYTSNAVETGRVIGRFKRAVPLRTNGQNFVDAAIMEPDPSITLSNNIMFFKHNGPFEFATTAEIDSLLSSGPNLRAPVFRSGRTLGPIGFPGNQLDVTLTRPENIFTEVVPFSSIHDTTNAAGTAGLSGINHVELRRYSNKTTFWNSYFGTRDSRGRPQTPIFKDQLPAFSQKSQNLISLIKNYDDHWWFSGNDMFIAQNQFSNNIGPLCTFAFPQSGDGTGNNILSTPDNRSQYVSAGYFTKIPYIGSQMTLGLSANKQANNNNGNGKLVFFNSGQHFKDRSTITLNGVSYNNGTTPVLLNGLSARYNDHWSDYPIPFDFDRDTVVFTLSTNDEVNGNTKSYHGNTDFLEPVTGNYLKISDFYFIKKPGQFHNPAQGYPTDPRQEFLRMPRIYFRGDTGQWVLVTDPAAFARRGYYNPLEVQGFDNTHQQGGPQFLKDIEDMGGIREFQTSQTMLSALTTFGFGGLGTINGRTVGPNKFSPSGKYTFLQTNSAKFEFVNVAEELNHPSKEPSLAGVMKVCSPVVGGPQSGVFWMLSAIPESESQAGPGIAGHTGKILTIGNNAVNNTIGTGSIFYDALNSRDITDPLYGTVAGNYIAGYDGMHSTWTELSGEWLDISSFGNGFLAVKDNGDLHYSFPPAIGLSANFADRVRDNLNHKTRTEKGTSAYYDLTANVWPEMGKYKKLLNENAFYFGWSIDYDNKLRWDNFWYEARFPVTKYTYTSAGTAWDTFNTEAASPMSMDAANCLIKENNDLYYVNINSITQMRFNEIFKNSASSFWENNIPKDQSRTGFFNFQAVKIAENIHSAAGINHGFDRRVFKGVGRQDTFYYLDTLAFLSGANDEFFITGRNPDNIYANVKREKDSIIVNRLAFNARVNFGGSIGVITIQDNIGIRSAQEQFPCSQGGDSGSAVLALFNPESESLSAWKVIGLVYAGPGAYDNATAIVSRIDRIQEQLHIEPWDGSIPSHQTRTHNVSAITDRQTPLFLTLSGVEFTNIGAPLTF